MSSYAISARLSVPASIQIIRHESCPTSRQADAEEPDSFGGILNLKALRVIRVTRIVKAARLMRIFRFVVALRTLITSIIHTLQSLFWALALLVLIVYVFAVLFVQAIHDHRLDPEIPDFPDTELHASELYFASLPETMLSLFMCIAGGVNWAEVQAPLKAISTLWVFAFLFYIAFTYFAVAWLRPFSNLFNQLCLR